MKLSLAGPFEYVEIVSDPSFSICKDYVAKADLDLIMTTEERPQLMEMMVKSGEFSTPEAAKHNMVQPALVVEDGAGNIVYKWSWHDLGKVGELWDEEGRQIAPTKDGHAHHVAIR